MKHFINNDEIKDKSAKALSNLDQRTRIFPCLENVEIGAKTGRLLKVLSAYDQKKKNKKLLQFFVATLKQLRIKLPLDGTLHFNGVSLHPGAGTQANSL